MKYERIIFFTAVVVYTISAWFSSGFLHGDEHYQIIEFAAYKMGNVSVDGLAWEFEAMIRPGLQPLIAFIVINIMEWISVSDPYLQTFVLRLLTGILALFSIRYFVETCHGMIRREYFRVFLFLSYFIWFLPFVNVRFSSETLSGLIFLNALTIQLDSTSRKGKYYIIGLLLGLSFLFRYQNAFLALGLILWLFFMEKVQFQKLFKLVGAALAVVILGIVIDYWLYGKFTLSAWNYFYVNLVEDVASGYGTERWWNYFYSIFRFSFFPLGIPIIIAFLLLIYKQPKSIFIWTILPFFIIHSIIAHKELRFLFPIVNLVPLLLVLAYQELNWDLTSWSRPKLIIVKFLAVLLIGINCIGCVTVSLKPADNGLTRITRYIRQNYGDESIRLISYDYSNPYGPWMLIASFYMERDLEDIRLESLSDLASDLFTENQVNLVVLKRNQAEVESAQTFITNHKLSKKVQSIPEWMEPLMTLYGGYRVHEIIQLYEVPAQ